MVASTRVLVVASGADTAESGDVGSALPNVASGRPCHWSTFGPLLANAKNRGNATTMMSTALEKSIEVDPAVLIPLYTVKPLRKVTVIAGL